MLLIKLLFLITFSAVAATTELPTFLTKQPMDALRFITIDGKYAYLKKRPGVLGMVSNFRSEDFISESSTSDFLIKSSRYKQKLVVEVVPNLHSELDLFKNHKIMTLEWGKTKTKEIGIGRGAKLHLRDEWISFYNPIEKIITIQAIATEKKYEIKLSKKTSPFFLPEVEMVSSDTVAYTAINEKGLSAFIQYNLTTRKSSVIYQSARPGIKFELCQQDGWMALGEFPYEGVRLSTKISKIPLNGSSNLSSMESIYTSSDPDNGNMICLPEAIFFVRTETYFRKVDLRKNEVARLDIKTNKIESKYSGNVTQLVEMDGRILIPIRGEYFVMEGASNLSKDELAKPTERKAPDKSEELPLDI